jgi:hypothetical protein
VKQVLRAFQQVRSLQASGHMAALRVAMTSGSIRASDPICTEIDRELAQASLELWEARQARDIAAESLKVAETPPRPPAFDVALAWAGSRYHYRYVGAE